MKCSECKCYLEAPVSLECGHLVCKDKCGTKIRKDNWLECSVCQTKTVLEAEKDLDGLMSWTVFSIILAKLKSGIEPGLIPEFRILHQEMNRPFPDRTAVEKDATKLLPRELHCLKNIICQKRQPKIEPQKPRGKYQGRTNRERFKHLLMTRAARLIALPRSEREELMANWTANKVKFAPPPPPDVMEELHEKCKAQAESIRLENEKPKVPSLFDIEVCRPNKNIWNTGAPTDLSSRRLEYVTTCLHVWNTQ